MKLCVILSLFCLLCTLTYGQDTTSNSQEILTTQRFIDDTEQKIDSLQGFFFRRTDSLRLQYQEKFDTIDSVQHRIKSKMDSISSLQRSLKKYLTANGLDSLQSGWKSKMDSLTLLSEYSAKASAVLDSINAVQAKTLSELNTKLQSLKDKTVGKLNELELPPQLSGKISETTDKINGFQIPAADLNIPNLDANGSIDIGVLKNLNIESPMTDLNIDQVGKTKNILGDLGEVSNVTEKIGEYGADAQAFAKGDLNELKTIPAAAEAKAEELSGLNEIKDQTKVLDEYKAMTGKMQNPDSLKEFALQQAKEIAVDHFAGKEEQLKQAMETLAKYKAKYPNLNSISDVTKRPPNEMKGKPLIERIVPGVGIQIQKKGEDLLVDFNPCVAYRFTGRISAGIGWNQRVGYHIDQSQFNHVARISGPRAYGEFKLCRGFSTRAEVEVMNTKLPPATRGQSVDPQHREWVWGAFAGIKKEYNFFKNIKGTALVMMRLYNPDHKSPYSDVVNVRFGFEFPMRKTSPKLEK
jgi:hypothetical protein